MKLFGLLLLLILPESGLLAQTAAPKQFTLGCNESESQAVLQATDPAYPYAIELARTLTGRGVQVKCLCASTSQRLFQGQGGAAYFRIDGGVFEALFLPKGKVFRVDLMEHAHNGHYIYSFRGTPTGRSMYSSKPMWRIQHENVLLLVDGDQPLAARLEQVLNSH